MNPTFFLLLPLGLLLLAARAGAYPTERFLVWAVAPVVASFVAAAVPLLEPFVLAFDGLLVALAAWDARSLPRRDHFRCERETPRVASMLRKHRVSLTVENLGPRALDLTIRDGLPEELSSDVIELRQVVPSRNRCVFEYEIRPRRRGDFRIPAVHLKSLSRWGLWRRLLQLPPASTVHVYPNLRQIDEYAVLARTNRLNLLGVRRSRQVGQDHEFERLRDYQQDDDYRHIDWRSTARRRKLTVREFQNSVNQRIVFLLDAGRMMTSEVSGVSLFDHALNATLMLSYVALQRGDAVGLMCFSNRIHSFVPPRSGAGQMNRLLHASFDRFPSMVESRYDEAFQYLAQKQPRRMLVVLATNVIDEVNGEQIQRRLSHIVGRHLPLGVFLRDRRLFDAVEEAETGRDVYRAAAAADILNWRDEVLGDLRSRGVLMLDVFPEEMTAPLINTYLDVKARQML